MGVNLTIIFTGLFFTAIFTTFEAALVSTDPLKVYAQVKNRKKLKKIMNFLQNPGQVINSLIVGINVLDITVAIFVLKTFQLYFSIIEATIYATMFSVLITFVCGEIIPKGIAVTFPRFIIINLFSVIQFFIFLLKPVVFMLDKITSIFFPKQINNTDSPINRADIELLFHQNRTIHSQHNMIYRVLSIDNVRIKEAKIPINEVIALDQELTVGEFKKEVKEYYHNRYPIFNEDIFDIIGYVESKEIFFVEDDLLPIKNFGKQAIFFPENNPVSDVIEELKEKEMPIAFVVDEFGAVSGMITQNNLMELIVGGALWTSLASERNTFSKNQQFWVVSGRQDIDELNDQIALGIEKDGFETLAGFIMTKLEKIPHITDTLEYKDFIYIVREMQGFFIAKIEIHKKQKEES